MNFEEYLISKKINSEAFRKAEPLLWNEWNSQFEVMSPASFTARNLYLINPIRRKYLLELPEINTVAKSNTPMPKPVIKLKPKIN